MMLDLRWQNLLCGHKLSLVKRGWAADSGEGFRVSFDISPQHRRIFVLLSLININTSLINHLSSTSTHLRATIPSSRMVLSFLSKFALHHAVAGKRAATYTSLFDPSWHIQEISFMFAACCLMNWALSPRISSYFFPSRRASIHSNTKTQWDIRVVSLLQSTLIGVMALWVVVNDKELANMTGVHERLWGYSKNVGIISGYSMGYYLWELATMMQNTRSFSAGMLLHSVCALIILSVCHVCAKYHLNSVGCLQD